VTEEERRAKLWCDARKARKVAEAERRKHLAGDPARRDALERNWKPILSLLRDLRYGTQED
jgi:hypothetical protein